MPKLTIDNFMIWMQVVCIKDHPDENMAIKAGDTGVVAKISESGIKPIGVQWDKPCGGHDLRGACDYGYGWWCPMSYISPITFHEEDYDVEADDLPSLDDLI